MEKAETNSEPLLEVTCKGMPCLEKTWRTNSLANIGDMIVLMVIIKINCLVRQSTMTNTMSKPSDGSSFLMKSMDVELHSLSGIGSCFRIP